MSAKRKVTRRRDNDPVRVYADGRVSYWTGGKPGDGDRKQERCGTRESAEERAEELRARLREGLKGVAPRTEVTLDELAQAALDALRKEHAPEGTIRQYKSDWNVHVPAEVGAVRCRDTEMYHFTSIFSGLVAAKASEQVIKNVARTVGHFIQFGVNNSYFKGNPFGTYEQRRGVVKMYRSRAAVEGNADKITVDLCPEVTDVDEYAASLELQYPHYGDRLAWLTFGSGLRICEALALRDDSIDLKTLDVQVDWQLDRYGSWPDLAYRRAARPAPPDCGPAIPRSPKASSRMPRAGRGRSADGSFRGIAPARSGRIRPASSPAPHGRSAIGSGPSTGCDTATRPGVSRRRRRAAMESHRHECRNGSDTDS